ncbi:MAG: PilZ domain-containing protein [Lachnospiraceae bacterium]|nr:PilZ domain-containing protein [Lachnospiraceae bacterium]
MQERRRGNRTLLESSIVINRIDEKESEEIKIAVIDLSKTGIGFTCEKELQMGAVYDGHLLIWTKERIHVYMKIIRKGQTADSFEYGAVFIGMQEIDSARIANYSIIEKTAKEMEENE